ncbi:serine/threonine-protein kinase PBS1 [Capsaspora owczarzaki ATCC 30864]|uniref:serine/threonine-protein kinase PBS1 n=1 Tax=Capsaspora owczarzaki (strain ATCC 30864) TaxID=595528 RepID=UPI0001FE6E72|nr:serine/threonine-protein kinase PBS1 [Capsaspora owczarzaki ATCC 30864]|eukprot:XP_004349310.1 serine/threonine-protein kinase PBS1 [Capsaspora owczarzaki ATCC 30864]
MLQSDDVIDNNNSLNRNFLTSTGINALRQTGSTICNSKDLDQQRVPSSVELAQIAARAAANVAEIQQLRAKLATKDQELQQLRSDLAAKDQQLTAKDQALAAKDQALAAKDQELAAQAHKLQSALDRIDVLEHNQAAIGSFSNFDGPVPQVPLATLVSATNNFATDSLLGEGAFGRVYGASLPGPRVAIKKLSAESKQGTVEFKSELDSLSKFRHANIIAILSYAEEGDERCLVYEFMPNGSVRDRLNRKNNTPSLTWAQRHRIAADVARGMHYVQTAFPDHALFHLDLKTDNVLLDAYFNAKVSDFGLVRAAQHLDDKSYLRTQTVQGTAAYMCPEFFDEGRMTIKTDVYAFGMILLELVTAAKPGNRLKEEMRKAVKNQAVLGMLDSALKLTEAERQRVGEFVTLAMECLEGFADDRPSFGQLIAHLDP